MSTGTLLELRNVTKRFNAGSGLFTRRSFTAVDNVSLEVPAGRTVGLVGESGSGKTTLARLALGLMKPSSGQILFEGRDFGAMRQDAWRRTRLRVQPIFQDPYSSLNPRQTVHEIVRAPLDVHHVHRPGGNRHAVADELDAVGLGPQYLDRLPHQLSGGERQRVNIARALILRPALVIADEPTSSVDVSVQAQLIELLTSIQRELHITYLFISHNLAVVRHICDFVAVMYLGRIIEFGTRDQVFRQPKHPYTEALLDAVLTPDPNRRRDTANFRAELPNPLETVGGCRFRNRCPHRFAKCIDEDPPDYAISETHWAACHLYESNRDYRRSTELMARQDVAKEVSS